MGEGYEIWYCGSDSKRNGVGIIMKKDLVDRVVEVWRSSDRMIGLKLELDGVIINIISAYAPQKGCTLEEKEVFWSDLEETVEMISREERVIVGADLNGHVGVGNNGDEDGMGERNDEGQAMVDFAKRMELVISNTLFQKKPGT